MSKKICSVCGGKVDKNKCVQCGYSEKKKTADEFSEFNTQNTENNYENLTEDEKIEFLNSDDNDATWHSNNSFDETENNTETKKSVIANIKNSKKTQNILDFLDNTNRVKGKFTKVVIVIAVCWGLVMIVPVVLYGINSEFNPVEKVEATGVDGDSTLVVDLANDHYVYSYSSIAPNDIGEKYSKTLAPGDYQVGVHIPEGTYSVQMSEDIDADFIVSDDINRIHYDRNLQADDGITKVRFRNVYLFTGATIKIENADGAILVSENAHMNSMNQVEPNIAKETFTIENDSLAGIEFPEGTYDITLTPGEGNYGGVLKSSYDVQQNIRTVDGNPFVYKNCELPKGTNLDLDNVSILLTPSEFNTI